MSDDRIRACLEDEIKRRNELAEVRQIAALDKEIKRRLCAGEPTRFMALAREFGLGKTFVQNRIQRARAVLEAEKLSNPDLVGQDYVAYELGVTSQAMSNWYQTGREKPGMPEPILISLSPGKRPVKAWHRAQIADWKTWYRDHVEGTSKFVPERNKKHAA